jgi:hypothetical protein
MPRKKLVYMPWYPRQFTTDEAVMLMDVTTEFAYRRLLDHQWLHLSVPEDIPSLRAICANKLTERETAAAWETLRPLFPPVEGKPGRRANRTLETIREEAEARSRARSEAANTRWHPDPKGPTGPAPAPLDQDGVSTAAIALTSALNKGLAENPHLKATGMAPRPVVSANQTGIVADWLLSGVVVLDAANLIYEAARKYRPSTRGKQINGLAYFDAMVRERAGKRPPEEPGDALPKWGSK